MKNKLSILVILVGTLFGAVASADAIPLSPWSEGTMSNHTWSFGVNAANGSAWVNFRVNTPHSRSSEEAPIYFSHKDYKFVSIPGLSYDANQAKIIYVNKAGQKVICATTEPGVSFFGNPVLNILTTGACDLRNERGSARTHYVYRVRFLSN